MEYDSASRLFFIVTKLPASLKRGNTIHQELVDHFFVNG
jgi:hypothetical protein